MPTLARRDQHSRQRKGPGSWLGISHRICFTKKDPDVHLDDGRHSRRRTYPTRTVEKPGVSPAVLMHLIANTVFLRLADVARDLPPYTERVALLPLDDGPLAEGPSQARAYQRLASELRQAVLGALQRDSKRPLGATNPARRADSSTGSAIWSAVRFTLCLPRAWTAG